jgi:hypothetical protein
MRAYNLICKCKNFRRSAKQTSPQRYKIWFAIDFIEFMLIFISNCEIKFLFMCIN